MHVQYGIILLRSTASLQFVLLLYAGGWTTKEDFWQVFSLNVCYSSNSLYNYLSTLLSAGCLM